MDVNILNLQRLFANPVRYEIPLFQRPYVWTHEEQWGPLWEDVQNTAEHYLERDARDSTPSNRQAHFLGAVVLQQQQVPTPMLMTRLVVDGQQRLTTLQLLLDAVQEVFKQRGDNSAAKRLELLVLNPEAFRGDNPEYAFKVWPTMADQEAFRYAMHNDLPSEKYERSRIVRAHEFFKLQIRQWLDDQPEGNGTRTEALEQAVTNLLELVVIDLELSDDPHVIFETLNARGTPLLQSDLIKNMVLYEADKMGGVSDPEDAARLWSFHDDWWRREVRQGRLLRPRIDVLLNYWLIMRKRDEVAADDVFSVFRRYYREENEPIEDIAADIGSVGESYRTLEEASRPGMATFLYRWEVMQAGVLTPVLLWLLSSEVPQPQMKKGLLALESHQLRRMACRMTTMGYNRLFISLVGRLEEKGAKYAGDTIVEYLGGQDSNVGLWPNDQQLADAFMTQPLYRLLTRGRLRMILEGIEEELRTAKAESQSVPRNLTIEHIMPQHWRQHWPLPTDMEDETKAELERDRLIHSMGNLTLVNNSLNPALSNAAWGDKRKEFDKHSVLFLNKTLLDEAPDVDVWDEAAIAERAKQLCQAAMRVWPHANNI